MDILRDCAIFGGQNNLTMKKSTLLLLSCAMGAAFALEPQPKELNLLSPNVEETLTADWHSQRAKQLALLLRASLMVLHPATTEKDMLETVELLSRESTPEHVMTPAALLAQYAALRYDDPKKIYDWMEEHIRPYRDTDPTALVALGPIAKGCGRDLLPLLKEAAESGSAEGALAYASRFCIREQNNAEEMGKWLTAANKASIGRAMPSQWHRTLLINMAENGEMKGGAFDALRGVCLAWAFLNLSPKDELAYLLPAVYENKGEFWRSCALISCNILLSQSEKPSPAVLKRVLHLARENDFSPEDLQTLKETAAQAGCREDMDELHDFPHGSLDFEIRLSSGDRLDRHDSSLLLDAFRKALNTYDTQEGDFFSREELRKIQEKIMLYVPTYPHTDYDEWLMQKKQYEKEMADFLTRREAWFDLYRLYHHKNAAERDEKRATEYLTKAVQAANADALYELAKPLKKDSIEYRELMRASMEAGNGNAAFCLYNLLREQSSVSEKQTELLLAYALSRGCGEAWQQVAETEQDPALLLVARTAAAAEKTDRLPALDDALTAYAAAHPETREAVRDIRLCLFSTVSPADFSEPANAQQCLKRLRSLLQEFGLSADKIAEVTRSFEERLEDEIRNDVFLKRMRKERREQQKKKQ